MVDVITLVLLYTIRIIAGAFAFSTALTFWMLIFSMFMFLNLTFVKRFPELMDAQLEGKQEITRNRGYYPNDLEMISSSGASSGYISVMMLALYIQEITTVALYSNPQVIWFACPVLLFWVSWVWFLTHRGAMHDDLIVFTIKDRAFDLIVVLSIASLASAQFGLFPYVALFVALVISVLVVLSKKPKWINCIVVHLRLLRWGSLSRLVRVVRDGVAGIRVWSDPLDITVSVTLGLLAWGVTSAAFVILLEFIGMFIPFTTAITIYPLSMLAGTASILPGGIGSTEATIVGMLSFLGVPINVAVTAAVGIRFSSIWFAVLCGIFTLNILEYRYRRADKMWISEH